MIKYLGSKRTLAPSIVETIRGCAGAESVLDLFSGTSRVGLALKTAGFRVSANDHNAYAATLARCYVQADRSTHAADAERLVAEFNAMPGRAGYFTETFCERARFFQPKNGARVDAIREASAAKGLPPQLEAVMLVSLMEAADRVDSTTGVQMAYLKRWAARSEKDLELRVPAMVDRPAAGPCRAHQMEAVDAAAAVAADVVYIDPPYNQHSYLGNYHIWETLVLWDQPEAYGVACKRTDCRERKSAFNSRPRFYDAMAAVLASVRARHVVVSFSDDGYIGRDAMEGLLSAVFAGSRLSVVEHDYKRYVGAQIGIHNPQGVRVGSVGRLRNKEYLFMVSAAETGAWLTPRRPNCSAGPTPSGPTLRAAV